MILRVPVGLEYSVSLADLRVPQRTTIVHPFSLSVRSNRFERLLKLKMTKICGSSKQQLKGCDRIMEPVRITQRHHRLRDRAVCRTDPPGKQSWEPPDEPPAGGAHLHSYGFTCRAMRNLKVLTPSPGSISRFRACWAHHTSRVEGDAQNVNAACLDPP